MSEALELYTFSVGTVSFHYTSADQDIDVLGMVFSSLYSLSRSSVAQSSEVLKSNLDVTMGRDCPVADLFRAQPPTAAVTVKLYVLEAANPTALPAVFWMGRVIQAVWQEDTCVLTADPSYSALQRMGLRRCWQVSCPHALYGTNCGVSKVAFRVTGGLITTTGGVNLTVAEAASKPDGYFSGGYVEYLNVLGILDRRMITTHVGAVVTIDRPFAPLPVGTVLNLYPGCAHTMDDCSNKFGNLVRYGGTPYIPHLNPFASDPVY